MSGFEQKSDLFPEARNAENVRAINNRCLLRSQQGHTVVIVSGIIIAQYASDDEMAQAHAMVSLVEQGLADQVDVARAFGCSTRTVRRYQRRFTEGGLANLGRQRGYPVGRVRLSSSRSQRIQHLKARGCSCREIASILGITDRAVRKTLHRLGIDTGRGTQSELNFEGGAGADPKLSAFVNAWADSTPSTSAGVDASPLPVSALPEPSPTVSMPAKSADPKLSGSLDSMPDSSPLDALSGADPKLSAFVSSADTDPADRSADRLLASLGLIDDAPPLFGCGHGIPRAGVLLAIPALVQSGIFDCAQKIYGSIGPAFYGLRTSLLTLLLMALWRIKRPEGLKEHSPEDLGRVLGLDRAPEVKTLRRKLTRLAEAGRAADLGRVLAEKRVASHGQAMGFLYVDGHVRVYHGKHPLPKAHVARMRISMPATSDYWINDTEGDPLFVITAEATAKVLGADFPSDFSRSVKEPSKDAKSPIVWPTRKSGC
jgi:prepilin-type processing-associated H-X9-DG protein